MSDKPIHPSICMCQECQDEALASELRADAEKLNLARLSRDTYRAKYEVMRERAKKAEAEARDITDQLARVLPSDTELRAENARLQAQLDAGTEAGWHALRNERDALHARIKDAPVGRVSVSGDYIQPLVVLPPSMKGKRVALVVLND